MSIENNLPYILNSLDTLVGAVLSLQPSRCWVRFKSSGLLVAASDISRLELIETKITGDKTISGFAIYVTGSITYPITKAYFTSKTETEVVYEALISWLASKQPKEDIFIVDDTVIVPR